MSQTEVFREVAHTLESVRITLHTVTADITKLIDLVDAERQIARNPPSTAVDHGGETKRGRLYRIWVDRDLNPPRASFHKFPDAARLAVRVPSTWELAQVDRLKVGDYEVVLLNASGETLDAAEVLRLAHFGGRGFSKESTSDAPLDGHGRPFLK